MIGCVCDCVYEQDGVCRLERAVSNGEGAPEKGCLHYIKKTKKDETIRYPEK